MTTQSLSWGQDPVADAGPDLPTVGAPPIILPAGGSVTVQLDGSASYSPYNFFTTLSWAEGADIVGTGQFPLVTFTTPGVHTITLTFLDENNYSATDTLDITVLTQLQADALCSPVLVAPAINKTVESDGTGNFAQIQSWLTSNGGALATDECGTLVWQNDYAEASWQAGVAPVLEFINVTFTALDESGRSVTTQATLSIVDTTAPPLNWEIGGAAVADYTQVNLRHKALPLTIKVTPGDLAGDSTLKRSYKFLCGKGKVDYVGTDTAILTSANVGSKVRVYFQATDTIGNSSATEWVEIEVVSHETKYKDRCREGLDNDDEDDRWHHGCTPGSFPRCGYRHSKGRH